jgi:hypothetical protein
MIIDWLTYMRDFGDTMYDVFMLPGDFLLSQLMLHLPTLALTLGVQDADSSFILLAAVSLLSWFLMGIVVGVVARFLQNLARIIGATARIASFRVSLAARNFRTWMICKIRQLIPRRRSGVADSAPEVELDDLDMAVLRSTAACGPGFATSAPELAEQLLMRPAQIQRRLEKLSNNKMLDTVIGSTEGFDNYRVSKSGAIFISMWQRKWRRGR